MEDEESVGFVDALSESCMQGDQEDVEMELSQDGLLPTEKTELAFLPRGKRLSDVAGPSSSAMSGDSRRFEESRPVRTVEKNKRKGSGSEQTQKKCRIDFGSAKRVDRRSMHAVGGPLRLFPLEAAMMEGSTLEVQMRKTTMEEKMNCDSEDEDADEDPDKPGTSRRARSAAKKETQARIHGMVTRRQQEAAEKAALEREREKEREEVEETLDIGKEEAKWIEFFNKMSVRSQRTALSHLVHSADDSHVRFLRQIIEPHFQRDFIACLPPELALKILEQLPPRVVCRIGSISRRWRQLCDDEGLWKMKCRGEWIEELPRPTQRFLGLWASQPGVTSAPSVQIPHHMTPDEIAEHRKQRKAIHGDCYRRCPHKALYLRQCRINANWKRKRIAGSCIFRSHEDHVITCLQLNGDMIVTGSDDNTLKVWNVEKPNDRFVDSPHLRHTLSGHTGGVWTSQVSADGKYIVSGSTDRTVRVWDSVTGAQVHCLTGHTSTVRCMALVGTTLVSGSRDTTLRVWDIVEGKLINVLLGHVAAVRCVQFDGRRVASGAYDFTVKIWNAHTGDCMHTLQGHTNRVYSLLMDAPRDLVVSGSLDTTIRVWNMETGACIVNLVGHTSLTSGMQLKGDILVSCNADSYIRVWNIRDNTCIHRLGGMPHGHTSAITSLQFLESGLVATSSDDGTVKLWDITRGVFVRDLIKLTSGGSGGCIWRLKATDTLLVCAVGSRNGTEDTKLILLDFDSGYP